MTKFHYQIRDAQSNVIHSSKNGVCKKGFDDPVKAAADGELIMDMKYPDKPYFVHVYPEDTEATNN
jgi:hypothetical protein